jgi:transposase
LIRTQENGTLKIVNTDGFPLAYEVLPGNTQDKQTLQDMLDKISERYGDAERVWIMDRGIPTDERCFRR